MPATRFSDPITSLLAAKSVSGATITNAKRLILELLSARPMNDEELLDAYQLMRVSFDCDPISPSGLRSRRSELRDEQLIEAVGYGKTRSGRSCIVWGLADV